jgi:F0F1-type ATP synthase membrane subunit c/vacuolar-type H+-ATPase subunit K
MHPLNSAAMSSDTRDDDPGWPLGILLLALVPGVGARRARQRIAGQRPDGLVATRMLFVSFTSALLMYGLVVFWVTAGQSGPNPPTTLAVALVIVGAGVSLVEPLFEKRLDCTTNATLIGSFRTRFFVRVAFAEVPALLGFVGAMVLYQPWPYLCGLLFAAIGFARLAPTRGALRRDQQQLDGGGCGRSLVRALRFVDLPDGTDPAQ